MGIDNGYPYSVAAEAVFFRKIRRVSPFRCSRALHASTGTAGETVAIHRAMILFRTGSPSRIS